MRNENTTRHTSPFITGMPRPPSSSARARAARRASLGHCQCVARLQRTRVAACSTSARSAASTGSASGYDADAISDGERDWTVPVAAAFLALGYAVVGILTVALAGTAQSAPSTTGVVAWSVGLCLLVGLPALAVGSGRAAIWSSYLPPALVAAAGIARRLLVTWLAISALALLGALLVDVGTAANVMSQLHTGAGDVVVVTAVSLVLAPNAVAFAGAYLLGPGFTVGAGTLVAPSAGCRCRAAPRGRGRSSGWLRPS